MKLYLRGKYYYFKPCINGKQKWVNTKEENKLKAKIFAEDWLHDKRQSQRKVASGKYDIETFLWTDFCDKFISYSKFNKSAPEADIRVINAMRDTILNYTHVFLMLCFGDSTNEQVSVPMIEYNGSWRMR